MIKTIKLRQLNKIIIISDSFIKKTNFPWCPPDWKNHRSDVWFFQKSPRDGRLSGHHGGPIEVPLKLLDYRSTIVLRSLREAHDWVPIMPRDALVSRTEDVKFSILDLSQDFFSFFTTLKKEKFRNIGDTFKRVIEILVNWHISTHIFWRG